MIDCDKPVVMWPNVSVKKIMTRNHIENCLPKLENLNKQMFLSESFYATSAWWKSLNGVCTLIIFHYMRAQWNKVTCLHILILRGRKLPPLLYIGSMEKFFWFFSSPCQCELLPSLGVRRLSSVNFLHFNLLLWNPSAKWIETW
jgi:hypothetical protein